MSFSYSFREKPRLSDRIRGKSGDELFNELRKEFDQDRKSFFDRPTSNFGSSAGSTFPRAAHFFEDPLSSRGRPDIRSHLEDLAQRHPEFADHLRYPAWTDDPAKTTTWGRKRRGSQDTEEASKQQNKEENNDSLRGRAKENLRNTVPDMGQKQQQTEESRGQRSWSAPPPDNRNDKPQRFVSKIEINPVNPDAKPQPQPQQSSSTGDATKPPMAPPKPQPQPQANQQSQHKSSTVRHIPIFVEGRDEPLLPKVEPEFTQQTSQQHYAPQSHFQQPSRKQTPPRFEHNQPHFEQQVPVQTRFEKEVPVQPRFEKEVPVQSRQKEVPIQRFEKEVPVQTKHEQPQQQQTQAEPQQPPINPNDPLYRVECVQKEVDELKAKIENFKGTSRKDKEYIVLDELLTRSLIKLDNIETEGRDEVRAARKNTIKSIQQYISVLENKVSGDEKKMEVLGETAEEKPEAMETEQSQTAADSQGKTDSGENPMDVEQEKVQGEAASNDTSSGTAQPTTEEKKEVSNGTSSEAEIKSA